MLGRNRRTVELRIPWSEGADLARIYEKGEVLARRDTDQFVELTVRLEPEDIERLGRYLFPPTSVPCP